MVPHHMMTKKRGEKKTEHDGYHDGKEDNVGLCQISKLSFLIPNVGNEHYWPVVDTNLLDLINLFMVISCK